MAKRGRKSHRFGSKKAGRKLRRGSHGRGRRSMKAVAGHLGGMALHHVGRKGRRGGRRSRRGRRSHRK